MTDVVERLNRIDIDDQGASLSTLDLVGEAAAEIERLRQENEHLKKFLAKIAKITNIHEPEQ